jgi:hypothetical protein
MEKLKLYFDRYNQLLPVLVLTLYCISAVVTAIQGSVVVNGETYEYSLNIKNYLGFAAVIINFVGFFTFKRFYKYILLTTILVGTFNFIIFSALETTTSFNIGSLRIGFQPSTFLAGFAAYLVNLKKVNNLIIDQFGPSPEEAEKNSKANWLESVNKFKVRYNNYSIEELNQILTENKYVAEALEAARQLITERTKPTIDNETSN